MVGVLIKSILRILFKGTNAFQSTSKFPNVQNSVLFQFRKSTRFSYNEGGYIFSYFTDFFITFAFESNIAEIWNASYTHESNRFFHAKLA